MQHSSYFYGALELHRDKGIRNLKVLGGITGGSREGGVSKGWGEFMESLRRVLELHLISRFRTGGDNAGFERVEVKGRGTRSFDVLTL